MRIAIVRATGPTPEIRDLVEELNGVLGAVYDALQRHGLSIEQLFQPNVRFFIARLDGPAVGWGGVAIFDEYAEVKRKYTRPAERGRGVATRYCARWRMGSWSKQVGLASRNGQLPTGSGL